MSFHPLFLEAASPGSAGLVIFAALVLVLINLTLITIVLKRYRKAGPNEALVISGRKIHLPDGTVSGTRIVRGGGTFILPVIESYQRLSLEPITVDTKPRNIALQHGAAADMQIMAQVKIHSDYRSILIASEHFLKSGPEQIKAITAQTMENHVRVAAREFTLEELKVKPDFLANKIKELSARDLEKMGLEIISVVLR